MTEINNFCITKEAGNTPSMLTISRDGYIRLSPAQLPSIQLVHLISGLDDDTPTRDGGGAVPTSISGYTEWLSKDQSVAVTIGWDWQGNAHRLKMVDTPRSNVMLCAVDGADLGHEETAAILAQWIDTLDWQSEVTAFLQQRY